MCSVLQTWLVRMDRPFATSTAPWSKVGGVCTTCSISRPRVRDGEHGAEPESKRSTSPPLTWRSRLCALTGGLRGLFLPKFLEWHTRSRFQAMLAGCDPVAYRERRRCRCLFSALCPNVFREREHQRWSGAEAMAHIGKQNAMLNSIVQKKNALFGAGHADRVDQDIESPTCAEGDRRPHWDWGDLSHNASIGGGAEAAVLGMKS